MRSHLGLLTIISLALLQIKLTTAADGYHYDRPTISTITHNNGGHHFGPIATVAPLPPVPALPPLPTARSSGSHLQTQTFVQVHPPPSQTASKSIANAYRPPSSAVSQYQHSYLPPSAAPHLNYQQGYAGLIPPSAPSAPDFIPSITLRSAEVAPEPQSRPGVFGQRIQTPSPSFPASLSQAAPQPLRIPFGKQAVIHPAIGDIYNVGDRQVKQYAVIEIIDNDIEQDTRPFISKPFIDNYRAQIGASGTGAVPPAPGQQIDSRSNALVLAQQNLARQRGGFATNDAIALGSGGLGVVRLANGKIYLGSGSLGYVSGQQHNAEIQAARTRTGSPTPDALHFGHGPLGDPANGRRFRY